MTDKLEPAGEVAAICKYGRFARSCMSVGLCTCGKADLQAKLEVLPAAGADSSFTRRRRDALASDLRLNGRNNVVYVVRERGQLLIRSDPRPWPFVRAFSGEHPNKHALAYIDRVTERGNANA